MSRIEFQPDLDAFCPADGAPLRLRDKDVIRGLDAGASGPVPQWETVDEGWGRFAVEFATQLEPSACREYVAMHHRVDVRDGDQLLDIACGSGLALELASIRGAHVSGIDASRRLVRIARDRNPGADIRVGDMAALPWADASFDVVTSFRGLWATTPTALGEARRVLRQGGRVSLTTWGHVKASPGFWALMPFSLAPEEKVREQADMKSLGRKGIGESMLAEAGFHEVRRHVVPFAWEFSDPETYAQVLATTGPAYEAIRVVGAKEFLKRCIEVASERLRDGLPLRAEIECIGFTARAPRSECGSPLLGHPVRTPDNATLADEDLETLGFVSNVSKLWMHDPTSWGTLFDAITITARGADLAISDRAIATIVATQVAGDSYCPLAWANKLGSLSDDESAVAVLRDQFDHLDDRQHAIADWARKVAQNPDGISHTDLQRLHDAGLSNPAVVRLTLFIALRLAFATVNHALGALPERAFLDHVSEPVRQAWAARHPAPSSNNASTEQERE